MRKKLEDFSEKVTYWIGSVQCLIVHSVFFIVIFALRFWGIASSDILLILTTIVSLEAVYMSIFLQMTVNKQGRELAEVSEGIGEIKEDVDEIQKDVDDIQEDVEEIQEEKEEAAHSTAK